MVPEFSAFLDQVRKVCNVRGQTGPLDQRISLLESVVAESEKNKSLVGESLDLISCRKNGYYFIITDLTGKPVCMIYVNLYILISNIQTWLHI